MYKILVIMLATSPSHDGGRSVASQVIEFETREQADTAYNALEHKLRGPRSNITEIIKLYEDPYES